MLTTCVFVLEVHHLTLHIEYVSRGIQTVVTVGSSNSLFDGRQASVAHSQTKVGGYLGGKPDDGIFGMVHTSS
jgi:hypothetical protein